MLLNLLMAPPLSVIIPGAGGGACVPLPATGNHGEPADKQSSNIFYDTRVVRNE